MATKLAANRIAVQVITVGRFWVITEGDGAALRDYKNRFEGASVAVNVGDRGDKYDLNAFKCGLEQTGQSLLF